MNARIPPALAAVLVAALIGFATGAQSPGRVVITGGRILDVASGRYREAGPILIEGDRIASIGAAPPDSAEPATRIDASGRTIVPGLIDLAARALPSVELDVDYFYALSLAHGVTGVRVVDAVLPWAVTQRDRVRRGDISAPRLWTSGPALVDRRPAARLAMLISREPIAAFVAVDAGSAGREASRQVDAHVDWVRTAADVPPDVIRAVVGAIRRRSIAVSAAPGATSMAQLAGLGVDAIDGLAAPLRGLEPSPVAVPDPEASATNQGRDRPSKGKSPPRAQQGSAPPEPSPDPVVLLDGQWTSSNAGDLAALARRIAQARVYVIPMLRLASQRLSARRNDAIDAELALVPERMRAARREAIARAAQGASAPGSSASRAWEAKRRFVAALSEAGGSIGAASGAGQDGWPVPGLALHHELALIVAAGLTPADAIRAATIGSAATLRATKTLGQLRPGAAADLFIVDGNPLADVAALRRITHVVRGGEVLDPKALLARAKRAGGRGK